MGKLSKNPYRVDQITHLAQLKVAVERSGETAGKKLMMFLSQKALTNQQGKLIMQFGYAREHLLDTLLLYPEVSGKQDEFTFTYLQPGEYFLTVVAGMTTIAYLLAVTLLIRFVGCS